MGRRQHPLTELQKGAIARELMRAASRRCENCHTPHGTTLMVSRYRAFRYELALHHVNGDGGDFHRANLRLWCQVCRGEADRPEGTVVLRPEEPGPRPSMEH